MTDSLSGAFDWNTLTIFPGLPDRPQEGACTRCRTTNWRREGDWLVCRTCEAQEPRVVAKRWARALALLAAFLLPVFVLGQEQASPRLHLPVLEPCSWGHKGSGPWFAAWEVEEKVEVKMTLAVSCGEAPCEVRKYLRAAGFDPEQAYVYGIPAGGSIVVNGIYPGIVRGGVGLGRLPARVEVRGADSWIARRVVFGTRVVWPATECRAPAWD